MPRITYSMYMNTDPSVVPKFNVSKYVSTRHGITLMRQYYTLMYQAPFYTILVMHRLSITYYGITMHAKVNTYMYAEVDIYMLAS